MHLTFGSVTTLAAKFDRAVTRIDPSDTTATIGRLHARKVHLSAVANATHGASIRQSPARLQPLSCPAPQVVPSKNGRAISSATTRPTSESTCLPWQATVAERRKFFQQLALESKPRAPARLERSEIPKRLGAGMDSYTVVWMPTAHDNIPSVDGEPTRDQGIDRPQARETGKSGKRPGVMVPRLGNIVQNRKAMMNRCSSSLVPDNEDTTVPAKFSMLRSVSSQAPLALSGSDSAPVSPNDETCLTMRLPMATAPATSASKRGDLERYFLNLATPASSSKEACLDDEPSLEEALSDYESDSSQSSSDFSEWSSPSPSPGSPDTEEPKRSWSQAYAEALGQPAFTPPGNDATWTEVKDAIGQLNAAIADEKENVVSEDAIELLQLAESHVANRDIQAAHDALMHALGGVTRIQAVQSENAMRSPPPILNGSAAGSGEEHLRTKSARLIWTIGS